MKFTVIELPDDFEKGMCLDCPLSYIEEESAELRCVFMYRYDECPLDIKTSDKEIAEQQRTGKWIPQFPYNNPGDDQECSICGFINGGATRFCPNCGSKMFEE